MNTFLASDLKLALLNANGLTLKRNGRTYKLRGLDPKDACEMNATGNGGQRHNLLRAAKKAKKVLVQV